MVIAPNTDEIFYAKKYLTVFPICQLPTPSFRFSRLRFQVGGPPQGVARPARTFLVGIGNDGLGAEERARKNTLTHLMLVPKVPHAPNAIGTSSQLDVFTPNSQ